MQAEDLAASADAAPRLSDLGASPAAEGRYEVVSELGVGGMGRVDLVEDAHLHRRVARKELLLPQPAMERRFLREARITAQLEHPGIVPVYELGRGGDGSLYYTMRRVRGRTLREELEDCGSLQERLALLSHFVDLCHALGYAHSRAVIHRDIKPDNVMVGSFGETLVLDWGLAKLAHEVDEVGDAVARR